LNSPIRTNTE